METRLLGPVALLQAFLPLIREARGRVLWIATPGLLPIPYVSSIHACDFAVNCIARTLALELLPWGIPSILIRCGGIQRDPREAGRESEETASAQRTERAGLYTQTLAEEEAQMEQFDRSRTGKEEVAAVVYKALSATRPKRRYRVGHLSGLSAVMELLPQTLVDALMARRWSIVGTRPSR